MRRLPYIAALAAIGCAQRPLVAPPPPPPPREAAAIADSVKYAFVDSVARAFLREWRLAWQETERAMPDPGSARDTTFRAYALHCHFAPVAPPLRAHIITGSIAAHASCPTWYPRSGPAVADERQQLDVAISSTRRLRIWALREQLRATLDSAARVNPRDTHLTRQRLRFALEMGALGDAWYIAEHCDIAVAECGLYRGLVLYQVGRVAEADSTFLDAAEMMPDGERCAWTDVSPLLDPAMRRAYATMPCAAREDFNARLWWLSDPLYLDPGNERRAEHFARRTLVLLLADLRRDARQSFEPRYGGDAVSETLIRYGWPTHVHWGGPAPDVDHGRWLLEHGADSLGPYVTREYSRGRLHAVPSGAAVMAPFDAPDTAWRLAAPAHGDDWPVEHFARERGGIVQLPAGQWVVFRRLQDARFAWAANVDTATPRASAATRRPVTLFQGRAISEQQRVADLDWPPGPRLLVDAPVAPGPSVIGIEMPGDSAHPAARSRFGAAVPPPLSALRAADVSQPLLFRVSPDAPTVVDADAAIARMFGSTTLRGEPRIGVFWESYGFSPTDTVDIALRVARTDRPGVVERLASVVGIGGGSRRVGIRMRELPGSSSAIQRQEGGVPVQMRSLVVNVSRLSKGTYALTIAMSRPGREPVTGERVFTLE